MIEKDVNLTETLQPLKNCPEEIFRKLFKLTNLLQSVALNKKSSNIFQDKSLLNVEYCALYKRGSLLGIEEPDFWGDSQFFDFFPLVPPMK